MIGRHDIEAGSGRDRREDANAKSRAVAKLTDQAQASVVRASLRGRFRVSIDEGNRNLVDLPQMGHEHVLQGLLDGENQRLLPTALDLIELLQQPPKFSGLCEICP